MRDLRLKPRWRRTIEGIREVWRWGQYCVIRDRVERERPWSLYYGPLTQRVSSARLAAPLRKLAERV